MRTSVGCQQSPSQRRREPSSLHHPVMYWRPPLRPCPQSQQFNGIILVNISRLPVVRQGCGMTRGRTPLLYLQYADWPLSCSHFPNPNRLHPIFIHADELNPRILHCVPNDTRPDLDSKGSPLTATLPKYWSQPKSRGPFASAFNWYCKSTSVTLQ